MQRKLGNFSWSYFEFLGSGSYAKIYKGKNTITGEDVAVKCMNMSTFSDEYMKEALENEIQVMKVLHSENVVSLYHVESDKKMTYIFLEFCGDGDLRKYIHDHSGNLSEEESLNILNQLMIGFRELVANGYIHRDIKPENILVKNKVFKLGDFGFACKADITGRKLIKDCVGTPTYMAPQLLENHPYTSKSDLWSIGMMFYEMLFGKTPWPSRDSNGFLINVRTSPLRFPYDKPIGQNTKHFITSCLTIEEDKRISWEQVFKHPILQSIAGITDQPILDLDTQSKIIIRRIQKIVQDRNLDTNLIFKRYQNENGEDLSPEQFSQLLQEIDSQLTFSDTQHLFTRVDLSKDGLVQMKEFQALFNDWDFSDITDRAEQIITDLKEIIKHNHLSLDQIFANFDLDKQGTLDKQEFYSLIEVVAPRMKAYEINPVFEKFDADGDGNVSFEEFYNILACGIQTQKCKPKSKKAKKLIEELNWLIKTYHIEPMQIFANFDVKKVGKLNCQEIFDILQIFDKDLSFEEGKIIFSLFKDGETSISFKGFCEMLNY